MTLYVWDRWGEEIYAGTFNTSSCESFANGALRWNGIANRTHHYRWWSLHPSFDAGNRVPTGVYTYKVYLTRCGGSQVLTPVGGEDAPHVNVIY